MFSTLVHLVKRNRGGETGNRKETLGIFQRFYSLFVVDRAAPTIASDFQNSYSTSIHSLSDVGHSSERRHLYHSGITWDSLIDVTAFAGQSSSGIHREQVVRAFGR